MSAVERKYMRQWACIRLKIIPEKIWRLRGCSDRIRIGRRRCQKEIRVLWPTIRCWNLWVKKIKQPKIKDSLCVQNQRRPNNKDTPLCTPTTTRYRSTAIKNSLWQKNLNCPLTNTKSVSERRCTKQNKEKPRKRAEIPEARPNRSKSKKMNGPSRPSRNRKRRRREVKKIRRRNLWGRARVMGWPRRKRKLLGIGFPTGSRKSSCWAGEGLV